MATLVIALAGRITGRTEHFDAAQAVAESVLSWPAAKSGNGILAMACLALIAIQRGDVARAAGYTSALEGQGGTMLASGGPIVAADRVLGLIAQSTSRLDDAASHFEDALAFCRRAGYRPELAWSLCDYTDMLLERNAGGDRQKATTSLDESLTIARELGMKPLVERVMSRRERLGA